MAYTQNTIVAPQASMGSDLTLDPSKSIDKPAIEPIVVQGNSFALNGESISYRFHVDEKTGDIMSDHFGGFVTETPHIPGNVPPNGWTMFGKLRREFPELGKGDFRNPAVRLRHHDGHTVSQFKYRSHEVIRGKPEYPELPATFGREDQVSTLVIHMFDAYSKIQADLLYSVFPAHDAIVRRVVVTNHGDETIIVERLASASIDFPHAEYDIIGLRGEWTRECTQARRTVEYGIQGFASNTGFSSHYYNPFLALASSTATESHGDAWGFSLVYTGSFSAEVEQSPHGLVRTTIGVNPLQLSWPLQPGERLVSPECVAIYSASGLGGMSRKYHRLFRENLINSKFVHQPRPPLLNSWEGLYFDFDETKIVRLATAASELGVKLFVLDDGWFGVKHPRNIDNAGLGDWIENPAKFPSGLKTAAEKITQLPITGSTDKLQFGIWVEPEMVNPSSELYAVHSEWAMTAGTHDRSEARNQLVLNMALPDVQEYIILAMTKLLQSAPISYVKYDHNRAIHESASPRSYHAYILGMYHVFRTLTTRFPNVLWEGCGSGGGRFDPGVLHYFPQIWASDNMDGIDRISTQFGASLVYPLSTMGAHVGAVPNHCTGRTQSLDFRAHVAMMGGSFGLELDPDTLEEAEKKKIPALLALAQVVNPIVIDGDLYRLRLPGASRHPAAMVVSRDGTRAVVFAFQLLSMTMHELPTLRLQGLIAEAKYRFDGKDVYSGATLMNGGVQLLFKGDYDSKVILLERL